MKVARIGPAVCFTCPACEREHLVYIEQRPDYPERDTWDFNGNMQAPTLTPSLLVKSHQWMPPVTPKNIDAWRAKPWHQERVDTVCHSFITDGRIQYLDDCTHEMRGMTIEIPKVRFNV